LRAHCGRAAPIASSFYAAVAIPSGPCDVLKGNCSSQLVIGARSAPSTVSRRLAGWQLVILSLALGDRHLAAIARAGRQGWGAVACDAIVIAILSYGLWYPLMRKYVVNQVVPHSLLIPAPTVGASYLILGDRLDWQSALAGATTIVGIAVIMLRRMPAAAR
jgi:drug/metabolite transporter (DMT)-like permease